MKKRLLLLLFCGIFSQLKAQMNPEGNWSGLMRVEAITLKIVFHVKAEAAGYSTTMDSPGQSAYDIKVYNTLWKAPTLTLQLPNMGAVFYGDMQGDSIIGSWTQAGHTFDLVLQREKEGAELDTYKGAKIQTPQGPFSYDIEEVFFTNEAAGIRLAGTVTKPKGDGPFPAVVLVSGSGPQDRDETIMGHKPFHVLAHEFTRSGIAVLRYDDRGVGKSTGKFSGASSADFAGDAAAALAFVRSKNFVQVGKAGILGHSEGGMIAWILATGPNKPDFAISLAGPCIAIDELLLLQSQAISATMGTPDSTIAKSLALNAKLYAIVKTEKDSAKARKLLEKELFSFHKQQKTGKMSKADKAALKQQLNTLLDPWFRYFIRFDPVPIIKQLDIPVFAANGSKDLQVTANENMRSMMDNLDYMKSPKSRIQQYIGLNHLFQSAETGLPQEYVELRETFSPQVMADLVEWINGL